MQKPLSGVKHSIDVSDQCHKPFPGTGAVAKGAFHVISV